MNVAAVTAEIEATLTRRLVEEWEWLLPAEITLPPPRHSEHSEDVLRGLGYSAEAIANFRAKGVI